MKSVKYNKSTELNIKIRQIDNTGYDSYERNSLKLLKIRTAISVTHDWVSLHGLPHNIAVCFADDSQLLLRAKNSKYNFMKRIVMN